MNNTLKQNTFKSSVWSFIGAGSRQFFGLGVFMVLSRLLSPQDFGTLAVAVAFVESTKILVRLGLTSELIRNPKFAQTEQSTAFWLSLSAGLLATLTLYFFADLLAAIFAEPAMANALKLLCIIPTLTAFTTVQEALLQRKFDFKSLATRTIYANLGAGAIAIYLAFTGWGIYSLVFQSIASLVINIAVLWWCLDWRPTFAFSLASARYQLYMGRPQMGSAMLNTVSTRSIDVIVGFFLGTAAVGYLRIAAKLQDFVVQFTIDPIVSVALSTFSKLQDDKAALRRAYRSLTQFCGLFTLPAFLGLAVISPLAITLAFGDKWLPSSLLMQILCIGSIGSAINYFFKPAMLAIAKPHIMFRVNLAQTAITLLLITIAAQFNVYWVMAAQATSILILMLITQRVLKTEIGLSTTHVIQVFYPPLLSAITMAATIFLLLRAPFMPTQPILQLAIALPVGAAVYGAMLYFGFPEYLANIRDKVLPTILSGKLGKLAKLTKFLKRA